MLFICVLRVNFTEGEYVAPKQESQKTSMNT